MPRVSLITPTYGRAKGLRAVYAALARQTVTDFEWLILDDSPAACPWFSDLDDGRIRYFHHAEARLTIGAKRNWLAERAQASVVAHIDDDDYYAPSYLAAMLAEIDRGADLVKLSAWYLYSLVYRTLGYWDLEAPDDLHFVWSPDPMKTINLRAAVGETPRWRDLALGFGFSYVYRKALWSAGAFPEQNFDEDLAFVRQALANGATINLMKDRHGLALHTLHRGNASVCLPQCRLPDFLLDRLFPVAARQFIAGLSDG